jgi:thiol-disulfide isomerase/thioredoxin
MTRSAKLLDGVVIAVAIGALGLSAFRLFSERTASPSPPTTAIPALDSLTGRRLSSLAVLSADGRLTDREFGESSPPTLLVYFRSTCPACESTAPMWRELAQQLPAHGRLVAVSVEGIATAKAWLERQGLTADEILIPKDGPTTVYEKWGITGVPLTVALEQGGRIKKAQLGVLNPATLKSFASEVSTAAWSGKNP